MLRGVGRCMQGLGEKAGLHPPALDQIKHQSALPHQQVLGNPSAQFLQQSTTGALQASESTISITMLLLQTQNKVLLSPCQLVSSGGKSV